MRTLFFDLDDTILRYDSVAELAWDEACEKYIHEFSSISAIHLKKAILSASNWFWSDDERFRKGRLNVKKARRDVLTKAFHDLANQNISLPNQKVANAIADYFTVRREELMEPFPNAIETLKTLRKRKIPLALLTNGAEANQQKKIDRFNLSQYFEIILIEGAVGYGKPDARIFSKALDHFKIQPHQASMVGDNLKCDVAGAKQIGIQAIWNDWANKGLPKNSPIKPDKIICNISELI